MAGSNRSPAPLNGVPPHWGTPEGDPNNPNNSAQRQQGLQQFGQPQFGQPPPPAGQPPVSQPQQPQPQQDALSRWAPPQQTYGQPPQFQPQPQGYAQPQQPQQSYAPAPAYGYPAGQPAHHQAHPPAQQPPQAAPFGNYGQPQDPFGQPQQPGQAGYETQYDRYAAPPAAHQQEVYQPQPPAADPHALSYPGDARRSADPRQNFGPAYPQSQAAGYGQPPSPSADPQNWDLAHYAPGQMPHGQAPHAHGVAAHGFGAPAPANPLAQHYPAFDHAPHHDPRYAQPVQPGWQQGATPQEAAYDLERYAQPPQQTGYAPQQGYGQQGYDTSQDQADPNAEQDFGYEEEEPVVEKRRGPRVMMVAGALIGAILVGGGLAKGYQMLGGSGNDTGKPPGISCRLHLELSHESKPR